MSDQWLDLVDHKFIIAFYAVIVWYAFLFVIDKGVQDDTNSKFKIVRWWHKMWDNIALTFLFAPLVVLFDKEILWLFAEQQGEKYNAISKLVYISSGPIVSVIIIAIKKFRK